MDTSLRRTLSTGPEGVGLTESWLYVHTLPWFPRKSRPIKLGKVYTRPKRLKNPTLWGGTYLYRLHKVVSPPGGRGSSFISFDSWMSNKGIDTSWGLHFAFTLEEVLQFFHF